MTAKYIVKESFGMSDKEKRKEKVAERLAEMILSEHNGKRKKTA